MHIVIIVVILIVIFIYVILPAMGFILFGAVCLGTAYSAVLSIKHFSEAVRDNIPKMGWMHPLMFGAFLVLTGWLASGWMASATPPSPSELHPSPRPAASPRQTATDSRPLPTLTARNEASGRVAPPTPPAVNPTGRRGVRPQAQPTFESRIGEPVPPMRIEAQPPLARPPEARLDSILLPFGQKMSGSITNDKTVDRYFVFLPTPGEVKVNFTNDGVHTALPGKTASIRWLDTDGKTVGESRGAVDFPHTDSKKLAAGAWYFEVVGQGGVGRTGTYSLMLDYFVNEVKPNHTRTNAQPLASGMTVKGVIDARARNAVYRIDLPKPGRLSLYATRDGDGGLKDMNIAWLEAGGKQIRKDNNTGVYDRYMDMESGTYFIEITPWSDNHSGTYVLRPSFTEARNNEKRPNHSRANAQPIMVGQTVKGFISHQNRSGIYRVDLRQSGRLTVNASRDDSVGLRDMNIAWLNADGGQIRKDNNTGKYSRNVDLEAGTYFIEITPWSEVHSGTYDLRIDFTAARNNEERPNNSRANAQAVSSGQAVRGFISHQNRNGMYRVDLRQSGRLTVNASRDDNVGLKDMNVAWLNADGGQIRKDNNTGKYSRNVDLEAGTYFIEITPWSDAHSGTYNLQIEFADAARLEQEKRQKEEGERLAKTCPLCKKVFGYNYTVGNTHTVVDAQGRNVTKTTRTRVGRQYVNKTETQWCDGKRKSWR